MSKNRKSALAICAILFAAFSGMSFLLFNNKNATFWIAYAFGVIAIAYQLYIWPKALGHNQTLKSRFLKFPILYIAAAYLVIQIIVSLVFIGFASQVGTVISLVLCGAILLAALLFTITAGITHDEVARVEERATEKTMFIKSCQIEVELLVAKAKDGEMQQRLKTLAEKIRYSDPMSDISLLPIEQEITASIKELSHTIKNNDATTFIAIDKVEYLITERNLKCKVLK